MTDSLTVLKNEAGDEGFFKFEDGYRNMTVAFSCKLTGNFIWVLTNADGEFEKTHVRLASPVTQKPLDCGIFLVRDNEAYPILYSGSRQILCDRIAQRYTVKNLDITEENEDMLSGADEHKYEKAEGFGEDADTAPRPMMQDASDEPITVQLDEDVMSDPPECFWDCNKNDYEKLLADNPSLEYMNALIPDSKWVQLEDYVFGVIFDENGDPMYLCYGFDYPWNENPPEKLEGYSQWIPKDVSAPHDNGMWVIYINAKTGERVK